MALLAIPQRTPLEYGIVAYNALFGAFSQSLHQEGALFREILELIQEVLVVIGDLCFVFGLSLSFVLFHVYVSELFILDWYVLIGAPIVTAHLRQELLGRPKVFAIAHFPALVLPLLLAPHLLAFLPREVILLIQGCLPLRETACIHITLMFPFFKEICV